MKHLLNIVCIFGLLAMSSVPVYATPFTPLEWQQKVPENFNHAFFGQQKHTTWVRDRNRNFIDDIIDRRLGVFGKKDIAIDWHKLPRDAKARKFSVIIDLNTFLTLNEIRGMILDQDDPDKKRNYGDLKYICKTITSVFLDNVKAINLPKIAEMSEVAMIEIQQGFQPALDISTRAVQAKATTLTTHPYHSMSAADAGLTGSGVAIAVIDTGVDDDHQQLAGKRVAGFDATKFEDVDNDGVDDNNDEPADGYANPDDDAHGFQGQGHGTPVAGIALGNGVAGADCRTPNDAPSEPKNCAGVAPGAELVDIKVCNGNNCNDSDISEALDWLGLNFDKLPDSDLKVRVANISLMIQSYECEEDEENCGTIQEFDSDGSSLIPQQVNYLSALGIVMVVAHGNSFGLNQGAGLRLTPSPGSASFAITVSATNVNRTINRDNDGIWSHGYLTGPRVDFDTHPDPLALKPDISAPGAYLWAPAKSSSNLYKQSSGTSLAAPHVSGAAAILLEKHPNMNPGDVKDALKRSADTSKNTAYNAGINPNWDIKYGSGMLNVWAALQKLKPTDVESTDVGFPTCNGPPDRPGRPCSLSGGLPSWNNNQDISTSAPPEVGVANEIQVEVENSGPNPATFLVNFGVYIFAVGNNQFFHIGTTEATVAAGDTETVSHSWTPSASDHQCVQVSIDYGPDTNFGNNITQRNLSVSPSVFNVRVENPFSVPAAFRIEPKSLREGWDCRCAVQDREFELHPYRDPPRIIQITFDPPKDAKPGERADCDVSVYAKQKGKEKEELIGGVTVQTFVPKPCRMVGWIKDQWGKAIPGAKVIIGKEPQLIKALSDKDGFVSFEGIPYRPQLITVITENYGEKSTKARFYCGAGTFEILVADEELTIETHRRSKDWAWDLQLEEGYKLKRQTK